MRFSIRFRAGNRFGAASKYSLREFCIAIVDKYSLTETEVYDIVTMGFAVDFENNDLKIRRLA